MWLEKELLALQVDNLSTRQQLDLLQDNAYIRCNLNSIVSSKSALNLVTKKDKSTNGTNPRYAQEINIAWDNICSYLRLAFSEVWEAICNNNVFPTNTITLDTLPENQDLDKKINSCKHFIEVIRSLVYGTYLRLPFSQDIQLQKLHSHLLISCQKSDSSGFNNIAGQKRIIFLQNWIEKLVITSSLTSYFITILKYSSPDKFIRKEPVQVTERKYIVTKHPGSDYLPLQNKNNIDSSPSLQSCTTTFSSYLRKQHPRSSEFVGLKIKFDSEVSDSSSFSESSDDHSIWKPVFKKKKTS